MLRLIDANANRAREGLRVIEDYARFLLDEGAICGQIKQLRHDLAESLSPLLADAILHRDTPGDVGTAVKTTAELCRADLADVVTAAGKRVGEALRALEEFLKTCDPQAAGSVESIRYRFYDVERRVVLTLRPGGCDFTTVRLYVLITEAVCRRPWLEAAEQAIRGGADCLQLREKELDGHELLDRARKLVTLCRKSGVKCVINDRVDVAIAAGADGVHVGQSDLPAIEARKLLGSGRIVGVSTHSLQQAKQAALDGADYVGVGPVFRSDTKPRDFLPGLELARQVAQANLPIPAVAIAGITADNVDEVLRAGMRAVAVTSGVVGQEDVCAVASAIKRRLTQ